ncbi:MAG: hypothetical protein HY876_05820 [Coriobacteriales bacterium]|nr:hypothetical protein [Coriobacteriales bacterium]
MSDTAPPHFEYGILAIRDERTQVKLARTAIAALLMTSLLMVPIGCSPEPRADGLRISFKLDPRLTKSLYMGERWVSGPKFTPPSRQGEVLVEARAEATAKAGNPPDIEATWESADADVLDVSPPKGRQIKLRIKAPGSTTLTVRGGGVEKAIGVRCTETARGTLKVVITQ